jgi:hypothetical protein
MISDEKRMVELLEEILKWNKVASIPRVRELLLDTLKTPEQKLAYQLSDGRNRTEVAALSNAGSSTVGEWWELWYKIGIADRKAVQGGFRAVRSFSLEDFGIETPKSEKSRIKQAREVAGENE